MKVLIAEDDHITRAGLVEILQHEGYEVIEAAHGEAALQAFETESPDFICLDVMMPRMSGYDLCKAIRQRNADIPIIFISAKSEEIDKVVGLELGADDFIVKPFGVKEVVARIRAVTRRCRAAHTQAAEASFVMDDLQVFPDELRALRGDEVIDLSLRDVHILQFLYNHRGQVVSRPTLFRECWGLSYLSNSRTLDQQISQLRKRIEIDPKKPCIIHTVHGAGYRFE